jgi:hypothetical protein
MSRKLTWTLSVDDLEDLFRHTFGRDLEVATINCEFDEMTETLIVELVSEDLEDGDEHYGVYTGVRIGEY